MKMPSSELKYCHFIPALDFRLSANTAEGKDTERTGGYQIDDRWWRVRGVRVKGNVRREREKTDE